MRTSRIFSPPFWVLTAIAAIGIATVVYAQGDDAAKRETLLPYVGQEVLVIDTTSGAQQYQHSDALLVFRLKLNAVQRDYFIVSRDVEGDKRDFLYPLAMVRRITTELNGSPLRPIVIELY